MVTFQATSLSATFWYLLTSLSMLAGMLLMGETVRAPWWLIAIVAAEAYASLRRFILKLSRTDANSSARPRVKRQRRLRHFVSMKLAAGAPVDELVARWLTLDALESVRLLRPAYSLHVCVPP